MKHIDLFAIAVLMLGIAVYSSARQAMLLAVAPSKRIVISESVQRALASHCAFRFAIPPGPFTRR